MEKYCLRVFILFFFSVTGKFRCSRLRLVSTIANNGCTRLSVSEELYISRNKKYILEK